MTPENIETALEFIKENPGNTVNQLVDYMEKKGKCSRLTTLKIVNEIIESEKVEDRKDKPNGFHSLFINDKNEFNRISMQLSEIEKIADAMEGPVEKILSIGPAEMIKKIPDRWIIRKLHDNFLAEYFNSVDNMLDVLLAYTNNKIFSEKDAWSVYTRIIKLKAKVNEQILIFEASSIEHVFLSYKVLLSSSLHKLREFNEKDVDYAKKNGINMNLHTNLIEKIQTFKKEFLGD